MPAYNFKDQFVPLIESGQKLTTIRQVRKKRPTRVGDRLFLFNRMRQSGCRLIKDTECVSIRAMGISIVSPKPGVLHVWASLDTRSLSADELFDLAESDGFKCIKDFGQFFLDNYGPTFSGQLIEWRP